MKGRPLEQGKVDRILELLRDPEIEIPAIGRRMGVSREAVHAINRRFQVRDYRGRRFWGPRGSILGLDKL